MNNKQRRIGYRLLLLLNTPLNRGLLRVVGRVGGPGPHGQQQQPQRASKAVAVAAVRLALQHPRTASLSYISNIIGDVCDDSTGSDLLLLLLLSSTTATAN